MCSRVILLACMAVSPALYALVPVSGQQTERPAQPPVVNTPAVAPSRNWVEQSFPPNGPMETAWKVEWGTTRGYGMFIKNAWFKTGPTKEWLQVLGDARVADLFVPYQPGVPRFWDVAYNFKLSELSAADVGPFGKLHICDNAGVQQPCVAEELRDRGVIWKSNSGVRRGQTLVLWACLHATNYKYLMEYGFQDDGSVVFRVGAAGRNLQGREWTSHMHNYYWRVDVNLGGPNHNTAYLMENIEPKDERNKLASLTTHALFNGGKEGGADWDARKFTMVRVENTQMKNIRGENIAYDLMPFRQGTSRHNGEKEECSLHDFWVTKANPKELSYRGLPTYCNDEDIVDTDIVLWYGTSMFHEPRSEDGIFEGNTWVGATIVGWSGFTLRPNNVFDRTPLFPNPKIPDPPANTKMKKGKGG